MVSLIFTMVRWLVQLFQLFSRNKILNSIRFTSVFFEVNRTSFHGEILQKLFASHHASEADNTHFSEKSCFRLRQKSTDLFHKCAGAIFPVYDRKKKMCLNFLSHTCQKNITLKH